MDDRDDDESDDDHEHDDAEGKRFVMQLGMSGCSVCRGGYEELEGVVEHRDDDIEDGHDDGDDHVRLVADRIGRETVFAAQLDEFAADLVKPVVEVSIAGQNRVKHDGAAVRGARFARERVNLVGQLVHPIEVVQTAGEDGQDDGERDVAFLDLHENPLC